MKRRNFLKAIPILASAPYFQDLGSTNESHLIAIGTVASKVVLQNQNELQFDSITIVSDSSIETSCLNADFIPFTPPDFAYHFLGEKKFLKRQPFPTTPLPQQIEAGIRSKKGEVVIFSALGKYTGTVLTASVAQAFCGSSNLRFAGSIPFEFEGECFRDEALKTIRAISSCHPSNFFDLEQIRQMHGNLSIKSAFTVADVNLIESISKEQ